MNYITNYPCQHCGNIAPGRFDNKDNLALKSQPCPSCGKNTPIFSIDEGQNEVVNHVGNFPLPWKHRAFNKDQSSCVVDATGKIILGSSIEKADSTVFALHDSIVEIMNRYAMFKTTFDHTRGKPDFYQCPLCLFEFEPIRYKYCEHGTCPKCKKIPVIKFRKVKVGLLETQCNKSARIYHDWQNS